MDTARPDDALLSAWLDGELDAPVQARVEAWLREHPADEARVRAWAADRAALRAHFEPLLDEPMPAALAALVQRGGHRGDRTDGHTDGRTDDRAEPSTGGSARAPGPGWRGAPPWAQAAAAAGLLLAGVLIGATLGPRGGPAPGLAQAPEPAATGGGWPQRAAVAHAVYAPEVRHPVEVNVAEGDPAAQRAQQEHLVRWLGKRLDMPVRLFDLGAQGFALVGGRLLPDAAGPSAQLMYQNGAGQRVTIYLRKPAQGSDTAFRYERDGELGMFYWTEAGFGYALVGPLGREALLALAEAVYRQAEQPPPTVARGASAP